MHDLFMNLVPPSDERESAGHCWMQQPKQKMRERQPRGRAAYPALRDER